MNDRACRRQLLRSHTLKKYYKLSKFKRLVNKYLQIQLNIEKKGNYDCLTNLREKTCHFY